MRIDVHAHYWTDGYLDMLVDLGRSDTSTQRGIGAGGGGELDARLAQWPRHAPSTTSTPRSPKQAVRYTN